MNLIHQYVGGAYFYSDYQEDAHSLLVAVPCRVGDLPGPLVALLDTGSRWCLLPPRMAEDLGCELEPDPAIPSLHTRFGLLPGRLERIPLRVLAIEGEDVEVDATWFLSPDWPGPVVLGWKGSLERIRVALDPTEDAFYFAPL